MITNRPWALVVAKALPRAKSRLSDALPASKREALAQLMLQRTLDAIEGATTIARTIVLTDGESVADIARRRGHDIVFDRPSTSRSSTSARSAGGHLGRVVDDGLAVAAARGARAAVVIVSDLPLVEACDVDEVGAALADHDVVVAPDHAGAGTNALGLRPVDRMQTCFGRATSFADHLERAAGLRLYVVHNPRLALDLDRPADLSALAHSETDPTSSAAHNYRTADPRR